MYLSMKNILLNKVVPDVFARRSDVLSDIWFNNVEFHKRCKYLIEANSGTGKSSLGSFLFGYRNDYVGDIAFDNINISTFSLNDWNILRRKHLAFLWQELRLFPELTALENVEIKNRLTDFQKKETILRWFEMLGISDKIDTPIAKMSYGQQQRVAMVRTLCQPFDFVFVDEPISHLDESNSGIMAQILVDEVERQNAGLIVTSIGKRMPITYDKILRL